MQMCLDNIPVFPVNSKSMEAFPPRFTGFRDLGNKEYEALFRRAGVLKRRLGEGRGRPTLERRTLAMLFEKPSTRTRVSFEAGMAQLGGHALVIDFANTQLSRGESLEDTARVLSSMCDAVMIRAFRHDLIERFASCSSVPVINGLSDRGHPCQLLADLFTVIEIRGSLEGLHVVWSGDVNNMCRTWIEAAEHLGFRLTVCSAKAVIERARVAGGKHVEFADDLMGAVEGADFVVTDVWVSMGEEARKEELVRLLEPFRVTRKVMAAAGEGARFMHCLPAGRGQEVEAEVLDGSRSVVWQEAENRMHAQKALLELLILGAIPDDE